MTTSAPPTLEVRGLQTHFATRAGVVKSVDGVDLHVHPGEILGLVGESGSGKSVTGFSIIGLVDPPGRVVSGQILFQGQDIAGLDQAALRALRGRRIAMIFQDPTMTLNPVLRIDTQMIEAIQAHEAVDRPAALARAREALVRVGIPAPDERLAAYPHELSGGMRQRIAIAMALLHSPALIVADEPTTALDVTIQGQILFEMQKLCRDSGTSLIWVTHDLAVVAGLADRVAVMYAGRIVESGSTADVIERAAHPYTVGLIGSVPSSERRGQPLTQIPGTAPSPTHRPAGCAFAPRCARASAQCATEPELTITEGHSVRCWHPHRMEANSDARHILA